MASTSSHIAFEVERTLRTIFKRCVECPKQSLQCPVCVLPEICSLIPQGCNSCAHMKCIVNPTPSTATKGTNVGAIAGGVVGGVAFVALAVFLVWRFWIKKMREEQDRELEEDWGTDDIANKKRRSEFQSSGAASTRSRGSLANSIMSRASNFIQIAYIPGVTNRSGTNSILNANPVPPIPAAFRSGQQTPKSPLSNEGDALFFRPGDLRDSTWSDSGTLRTTRNRDTQYTMQSITPSLARSSMASSIVYFDDATAAPMPATTIHRGAAPRVVSIKTASSTPTSESPPSSSSSQKGFQVVIPRQGTGITTKATQVTVGGRGKGRFPVQQSGAATTARHVPGMPSPLGGQDAAELDDDEEHARARKSLLREEASNSPTAQPAVSPFADPPERPTSLSATSPTRPNPYASMASSIGRNMDSPLRRGTKSIGGLSAVIEEASRRLSKSSSEALVDTSEQPASKDSPFSDEHATE